MNDLVSVSVAISTLDRPDALARCLDALLSGTALPAEVVVVDQGEGVETRQVIEAREDRGSHLVYVRQARRGLSASQNEAVRRTTQPLVAALDDDAVPEPDWLRRVVAALETKRYDVVTGRLLPLERETPGRYAVSSRRSTRAKTYTGRALPWAIGSGSNFALPREWYERAGGCDERLGTGSPGLAANDMDLFYRLLRAGARIRYEPALVVRHELKSTAERRSRRFSYGYGIGACCAIWLREGDLYALAVAARWLALRLRRAARSLLLARPRGLGEEALVLRGTLAGVRYGFSVADTPRRSDPGDDPSHG